MIAVPTSNQRLGGICLRSPSKQELAGDIHSVLSQFDQLGLRPCIEMADQLPSPYGGIEASFHLRADLIQAWAPDCDTMGLSVKLQLDTERRTADLEREIVLALLLGPAVFEFPSHAEFASSVRIRRNIVLAARKTALSFQTAEASRPEDCWTYDGERGFTVRPGQALIAALQKATQPESRRNFN